MGGVAARLGICLLLLAGCNGGLDSARPTVGPTITPARPPTIAPEPLPAALVGDWTQTGNTSTVSPTYTRRIYRFYADGRYEYWNEFCESFNVCSGGYEAGIAQVQGQVISFVPQTPSVEGPRSFSFETGPDPFVGDMQLRLLTPNGPDVFFAGGPG